MQLHDDIYGTYNITDDVLIALLVSAPMQRLKRLEQHGLPHKFWQIPSFSRYDHSVGVMLLIRELGGNLEEQIAGLLHDVSHTAFSHLIDWVFGEGGDQDYQDKHHREVIEKSELKDILISFGYTPERIWNYENFSLLEESIPDLCADRVDYALREFDLLTAKHIYSHLINYKGEILFNEKEAAVEFGTLFLEAQRDIWASFEGVSRYLLFAQALKLALDDHLIKIDDFWTDDEQICTKLAKSKNAKIKEILDILKEKTLDDLPKSTKAKTIKFRHVDPKVLIHGKIHRTSDISPKFKTSLEKARDENKQGVFVAQLPAYIHVT